MGAADAAAVVAREKPADDNPSGCSGSRSSTRPRLYGLASELGCCGIADAVVDDVSGGGHRRTGKAPSSLRLSLHVRPTSVVMASADGTANGTIRAGAIASPVWIFNPRHRLANARVQAPGAGAGHDSLLLSSLLTHRNGNNSAQCDKIVQRRRATT